jgi:hypothetical protein
LVFFELTVAATVRIIGLNSLEKLFVYQFFGKLEIKSVGAAVTDLFPSVSKEVEERLQDTGVLNDGKLAKVQETPLPHLRGKGVILDGRGRSLTSFITSLGSTTTSLGRRAELIAVELPLVDDHALRIVKSFGELLKTNLL